MAAKLFVVGLALLALTPLAGAWGWLPAWSGASFLLVSFCYATRRPRALGKRQDGSLATLPSFVLAPYSGMTWLTWHVARLISKEHPWDRLNERVILSRRLLPGEVPDGVACVLDLTAEFPEPPPVIAGRHYISFPILDGSVPEQRALETALSALPDGEGTVLIHCAQGHGRTALVASCLALLRGWATDAESAERLVLAVRPDARMSAVQRTYLRSVEAGIRGLAGSAVRIPQEGCKWAPLSLTNSPIRGESVP